MIEEIKIKNFKCFKNLEICCGKLNVFSGLNGMGKSTVLQALLLLRQSKEQNFMPSRVCLSGNYINLGVGKDILYEHADNEKIEIGVVDSQKHFSIDINYKEKFDVLTAEVKEEMGKDFLNAEFEYLSAERMSPQVTYPKSSFFIDTKMQLGVNGQYTAHFLSKNQDEKVEWNSCNGKNSTIKQAVQYWLNEISPNVKLEAMEIDNTDSAKIGFYYIDKEKTRLYRPTNVGFGISYILPVIVALIKARNNSILVIENPEAHLHPQGQRKMGELIARCAAGGTQIFLETHSDHVLNGIRIAVKNKLIVCSDVKLFYFSKEMIVQEIVHTAQTPVLKEDGKLDYWPDGFFDEWEKALDEIL